MLSTSKLPWRSVSFFGCRSLSAIADVQAEKLQRHIERKSTPPTEAEQPNVRFGHTFSDHMLQVAWNSADGWGSPQIVPYGNLSLSPAAPALHYAVECFEGMKAYRGADGKIRMFRPLENMKRMNNSCRVSRLPEFNGEEVATCIKELLRVDRDWIPSAPDCSLYIRPSVIGTEPHLGVNASGEALLYVITCPVGPYFKDGGFKPVRLLADPKYVRAWPGGHGASKLGSNYGPTISPQKEAEARDCSQVLWLFGPEQNITEVGTMNMFMFWVNKAGEKELVTPPLNGLILPGVTRASLLALAQSWGECKVTERDFTMKDIVEAKAENRLIEMFGAGTACVVSPVGSILYEDKIIEIPTMDTGAHIARKCHKSLTDIQYGRVKHEWSVDIDE
ncbi:branched-chain-amino-acid aminotransferase-like [Sycon ciliatum]|uniref:branched-chain-amino-acid aminotransferase-like n=1 Tax=Sycon ciliatum TaxID=27933 RepID=UPI0031F5F551|eukprot:scpid79110/ scgid30350/ Branched-chain-amino-acid aminotransferase